MYAVGSQRTLFDIAEGVAYFNTASNAPLLNASRARLREAAGAKSRPWERLPSDFFADAEHIRQLVAGLARSWSLMSPSRLVHCRWISRRSIRISWWRQVTSGCCALTASA